jgi:hypothetical protein
VIRITNGSLLFTLLLGLSFFLPDNRSSAQPMDLLDDSVGIRTVFRKVFPAMTDNQFDSIAGQYQRSRTVVKKEVFRSVAGLNMDPAAPPTTIFPRWRIPDTTNTK